tara:strand:+ start:31 stop:573 length:543 start_codon:yes stop_codon:yes gene_type:complete
MKTKYLILIFSLISLLVLSACKNPFRYTDAREIPVDGEERVRKNIEEGRGITIFNNKKKGGVFDFASSNELWRASIEVLDFVSFTNASYSGGIIITDWFSGNTNSNENNQRELKITVRFLSNEIRADGIKIVIHEKVCTDKAKINCNISKIKSNIGNDIKLAILKKAALLKKETGKKTKK